MTFMYLGGEQGGLLVLGLTHTDLDKIRSGQQAFIPRSETEENMPVDLAVICEPTHADLQVRLQRYVDSAQEMLKSRGYKAPTIKEYHGGPSGL